MSYVKRGIVNVICNNTNVAFIDIRYSSRDDFSDSVIRVKRYKLNLNNWDNYK
jgi:hypothetical protein